MNDSRVASRSPSARHVVVTAQIAAAVAARRRFDDRTARPDAHAEASVFVRFHVLQTRIVAADLDAVAAVTDRTDVRYQAVARAHAHAVARIAGHVHVAQL